MYRSFSNLTFAVFLAFFVSSLFAYAGNKTQKIENFSLRDYNGQKHELKEYSHSKAIVVIFVATRCPVSNAYNERMANLYKKYSDRGIAFVGINSNKKEDEQEIREHAAKNHLEFDILKDWNNMVADKFDAKVTPEVYVLSPEFKLLYHGRIDDSRRISKVTSKDLQSVLDAILAGKPVPVTDTKAFGCTIKRVSK